MEEKQDDTEVDGQKLKHQLSLMIENWSEP